MNSSDLTSSILWLIFVIGIAAAYTYIDIDKKRSASRVAISAIEHGLIQCVEKVGVHDELVWKKECK